MASTDLRTEYPSLMIGRNYWLHNQQQNVHIAAWLGQNGKWRLIDSADWLPNETVIGSGWVFAEPLHYYSNPVIDNEAPARAFALGKESAIKELAAALDKFAPDLADTLTERYLAAQELLPLLNEISGDKLDNDQGPERV